MSTFLDFLESKRLTSKQLLVHICIGRGPGCGDSLDCASHLSRNGIDEYPSRVVRQYDLYEE